jgi:glyoxylase I family protein
MVHKLGLGIVLWGVLFTAGCCELEMDAVGQSGKRVRLEHVAINVAEPVEMAQWYCENLGMKVLRKGAAPVNNRFIADAGENMMLELYNNPEGLVPDYGAKGPLELHIAFMVDDMDRTVKKLIAAGARPEGDVKVTPGGDEIAVLRDPWGVAIQFVTRAKPMLSH